MKLMSARRAISAGVVAAASVAAFAVPSAASAALPEHCKGSSIEGAGSSLQAEAQAVWDPGFNISKAGCIGGPTVKYHSIGSGAGFHEWSEHHNFGTIGFVGTDNTVNQSEKETVEHDVEAGKESQLLTIPVLQGAVSVDVNLPANCVANSKAAGRLDLNQAMLEKIYSVGATWQEVAEEEGAGNSITGEGCVLTGKVIPVVRKDSSGTTHIFKKFLNLTNSAKMAVEGGGEKNWSELAEGSQSKNWPLAAEVVHASEETGPGLLKEVAAKPGSLGYANLADANNPANGGFNGQSPQRFWVNFESSRKEKTTSKGLKIVRKYQAPIKGEESNCKDTEFSNEGGTFPPPEPTSPWNEVTAKDQSKSYALCGLTYYEAFTGGTAEEARSVIDFENYVLSSKGGAKEIKHHDYTPLSKTLDAEALAAVTLVTG
jgi:ABC-type phosphate transport system substrate-binding protein